MAELLLFQEREVGNAAELTLTPIGREEAEVTYR
jgi:hypothetical protein